jgi:hypothetical protein
MGRNISYNTIFCGPLQAIENNSLNMQAIHVDSCFFLPLFPSSNPKTEILIAVASA